MDPGACESIGLWFIHAVYLVALELLPWEYLAVVSEFMFRFFSFPGIFFASVVQNCLLNAEMLQPVYLV